MLGDNPFFGISHLSPSKSEQYLKDSSRWSTAAEIISSAPSLGINSFMISSHRETKTLLDAAGYGVRKSLPDVCLVVPNVHDLNSKAASNGVLGAVRSLFKKPSSLRSYSIKRLFERAVMNDIVYPDVTYVALHNVVVDILLGMRATSLLKAFCWLSVHCGYKPVLITLNPLKLLSLKIRCHAICCYYNSLLYNVSDDPSSVLDTFERQNHISEIWAMGILASGAVSYDKLQNDALLK
jgi:hypothetical protein